MAITIPIAISIPQIHPFFNEWLAIELTLVQLRTDTRFSRVRSGITQIVTEINANSDEFSPHSSMPFFASITS
jgi:hypothetical protein